MIFTQKFIYRSDLQKNPMITYVFGDNYQRKGYGGQAKEMRGEPNAIGVRTKWAPNNEPSSFFDDIHLSYVSYRSTVNARTSVLIAEDILRVADVITKGGIVCLPEDGLGTGMSHLETRAPKTLKYINDLIEYLYTVEKRYGVTPSSPKELDDMYRKEIL